MAKKKGIRVGKYRLMPLGMILFGVLILVILVLGTVVIIDLIGKPGTENATPVAAAPTVTATPIVVGTPTAVIATPTPTPDPTPTPTPALRSATVRTLGEIAIQDNILSAAKTETSYDFVPMLEHIKQVVGNADLTIADVEGAMGGEGETGYTGGGSLNTPPQLMLALMDAGVDMLTLANDHALDTYWSGLEATIENCNKCGMDYMGAALTQEEHDTPNIVEVNGIDIAFLNYTTSLNGMEKSSESAALTYGVNLVTNSNCAKDVQAAKEAGADVIVAYVSWGTMFQRTPDDAQQKIALILANAGVDVIIGYNPHTVQPAFNLEVQQEDGTTKQVLCLCATGNFLSDVRQQYFDSGIVFEFTIQETDSGAFEIVNPTYIPTYVWRYQDDTGAYSYYVLAAGEWLEEKPTNMSEADYARLKQVWNEVQQTMGTSVAKVSAN